MDIINYCEVDSLEEHLINRQIQEALLDAKTFDWALNYDTKNLGKNISTAYNLPIDEWINVKSKNDLNTVNAEYYIKLAKLNLFLAEKFYDKILPYANVYNSTWNTGGVYYEKLIASGEVTLLKTKLRSHSGHGKFGFKTKLEGTYADTDLYNGSLDTDFELKIVNKYNNLTIYRNINGCEDSYNYTVWYI